MHLRVAMSLLAIVAVIDCDQRLGTNQMGRNTEGTNPTGTIPSRTNAMETSPKPSLLQAVKNGLVVIRDLFYFIFGNVPMFRRLLTFASELTASFFPLEPLPLIPEPCWGDRPSSDTSVRPFRVRWSNEMISDLCGRIAHRRQLTPALRGSANTYGTNSDYLAHLLDYWAHEYDFSRREEWLNSFPQYTTNIQGLSIHYIHVKPLNPGKKVLPLLLLHGWPSTAFEYVHVIRHLMVEREDCEFAFEIIVPDLPGYGYTEATNKIGMAPYQMGIIMKNLMQRLGRRRFYIHAGDMGQLVADSMAVLFPDRVLGLHTNIACSLRPQTLVKWVLGQLYPPAVVEARYEDRMYPLAERAKFYLENMGYFHVHAAKPDSLSHGADDSPVALISWLVITIITGAGPKNQLALDGNLTRLFDMRDWLDSFTIYWDAQCLATSIRMYAEMLAVIRDPTTVDILTTPTRVPFAAIRFREEIIYMPDDFLRDKYPNLVQATTLDFGGHFAGYQDPGVLGDSIWTSMISDLCGRIAHRRQLTPALRGSANTYGTNSDYLAHLLDYWAHEYDFSRREEWLNSFPQYTTNIQGLSIHYIHVKPLNPGKKVLPLLLLHGWPSTAFEYVHVIRHLMVEREDCEFAFEIIVPDLPGYGYTEATNKIGMAPYQMGIIMKNLMQRLGRRRFYIHAGDMGQLVADSMAVLFPDRVLGLHTNIACSLRPQTLVKWVLGQLYPPAVVEARYEDRMYPLAERAKFYLENMGYFHVHAAKPDSLSHGADDSPVALISWLVITIITGAGPKNQLALDGNLTRLFDMRDWLDSFTIYWDAQCLATSIRMYAEMLAVIRDPTTVDILTTPTRVPFAAIRFREEIIYMPDDFLRDKYPNLVQATTLDFGGHFAGYQDPGVLGDSIWTSVKKMELSHIG